MKTKESMKSKNRKNEKGAAMVMVVLISFLLLVASAGLLLEATMNTANVTDATADQQAYNAAESGIQSAINVLRGNVLLTDANRIDTTKPATDPANRIDFKKAVTLSSTNLSTDTGSVARLSRWLNYTYTAGAITDWRVPIGSAATYAPQSGNAFRLNITDPDNASTSNISYSTSGIIGEGDCAVSGGTSKKRICGTDSNNRITIEFVDETVTNLNVSSGSALTRFGYFVFDVRGTGTFSSRLRFQIAVNMTQPYSATKYIRGWIEPGTMTNNTTGTVKITYESQLFNIMGSVISVTCPNSGVCATINTTVTNPSLTPPIVGFQVTPFTINSNAGGCAGCTPVRANMTPAEATRLLVRSTGFGPRGAKKVLEAIIQKNFLNGMQAPATLTLIGPNTDSTGGNFIFNPGSSAAMQYSGDDIASNFYIPPIGTNNSSNLTLVQDSVNGLAPHPFNGVVVGTPSDVGGEMPTWLQSPANLDSTIKMLEQIAYSSGRIFPTADGSLPASGDFGNNLTAKGITYVNGDVSFTGSGGGILVVTGKLTLDGNFNFNGLIIVTGTGGIERNGGGGGMLQGNVIIAPYNPNNLAGGFLAPKYDLSGGGNSDIIYNSNSVTDGLLGASNFVLGVAEK
jgi:hypothetical protein